MTFNVEHVRSMNNKVGEGPIWSPDGQTLYWVDLGAQQFYRLVPETGEFQSYDTDQQIGCIAFHEAGGLIIVMTGGVFHWHNDEMTTIISHETLGATSRFNDGAVDRAGRLWVGTASGKPENKLYCIHPDHHFDVAKTDCRISNGIGWSPDNKTMYYSDSGGEGIVYTYDYDLSTGQASNRRVFLPPTDDASVADGLTVDQDGMIWIAYWDGWRVECRAPDGQLVAQIDMPVQRPTSCIFGGKDMNELYITSAGKELSADEQPLAGDLFRVRVNSVGLPETPCKLALPSQ